MSEKIGEGVIQSAFAEHLKTRLERSAEAGKPYVSANLQGLADKTFADYFASTSSRCVLIEFKEFEREYKDEEEKRLRFDLCAALADSIYDDEEELGARGHFIAWGNADNSTIESICSYAQKVCPLFGITFEYKGSCFAEKHFICEFLDARIGLDLKEMNIYVQLLTKIASQGQSDPCPKFRALLLSFDENTSEFKKARFNDLCELATIMQIAMKQVKRPSPGGQT